MAPRFRLRPLVLAALPLLGPIVAPAATADELLRGAIDLH
jgi:hypothetical protein